MYNSLISHLFLRAQERILGFLPETFACLAVTFIIMVALLLIWALKLWRPPPE
jgi:hypothetical protein